MNFNRGDTIKACYLIPHEKHNIKFGFMHGNYIIDDEYTNLFDLIDFRGEIHVNYYKDEVSTAKVLLIEKVINGIWSRRYNIGSR